MNHLHAGRKSAVVLHDPSNMFYMTEGYTGEGLVYLSEVQKVIVTDFRYTEQAERQAYRAGGAPGSRIPGRDDGAGAEP